MKTECSIVMDLLPLYVENMVNTETAQYISEHVAKCSECQAELAKLKGTEILPVTKSTSEHKSDTKSTFKTVMKRVNRKFYMLSYSLIIFFVFLGFGWTAGENLLYNSLIMPIVGIFGYFVFGVKSLYKMPILLLIVDMFLCISGLVKLDFYSAFMWTLIYSIFVFVGIAIAFLLHYALRKEKTDD